MFRRLRRGEPASARSAPVVARRMHLGGEMDDDTSEPALDALLAELDHADDEHPDVAVSHESQWTLSVFASGLVVWENAEEGEPRHLDGLPRQEARRLLGLLAQGDLAAVHDQDWQPGYAG